MSSSDVEGWHVLLLNMSRSSTFVFYHLISIQTCLLLYLNQPHFLFLPFCLLPYVLPIHYWTTFIKTKGWGNIFTTEKTIESLRCAKIDFRQTWHCLHWKVVLKHRIYNLWKIVLEFALRNSYATGCHHTAKQLYCFATWGHVDTAPRFVTVDLAMVVSHKRT